MISISEHLLEEHSRARRARLSVRVLWFVARSLRGRRKVVKETYPISNAREESAKRNRFLIQPEELMRGEQYARSQELEVVGFYHSHPDSPARPSQYDLEHAWPTYSYIIVSTSEGHAGDLFSWEQEPDRSKFNPEEIRVIRG